jgi:hypothetical protein
LISNLKIVKVCTWTNNQQIGVYQELIKSIKVIQSIRAYEPIPDYNDQAALCLPWRDGRQLFHPAHASSEPKDRYLAKATFVREPIVAGSIRNRS